MSKFDAIYKRIEEQMPVAPQQQNQAAGIPPRPVAANTAQQPPIDPAIMKELIAATTEQQVHMALQKMQAVQQQKPATPNQPAV
jgi:hypothetical protein